MEGRLVGREPELAALAELVEDAGAGRGRVALITGEAGIGKTSLAEAVDAMARALRLRHCVGPLLVVGDAVVLAVDAGAEQPPWDSRVA